MICIAWMVYGIWLGVWVILSFSSSLIEIKKEKKTILDNDLPLVSIIISLRNESVNIPQLCKSLSALNYPKHKLEIWLGDDHSDDDTMKVLEQCKPLKAHVISYAQSVDIAGKQAVLIDLIARSKGEYLLFTDGDMVFNENWVLGMLYQISDNNPQMKLGLTMVNGSGWFDRMQNSDWIMNQYMIAWLSKKGVYLTAWGNNMMIDRKTYDVVGGFERIENSITEDVAMMRSVVAQHGNVEIELSSSTLARTLPAQNMSNWLHQRMRWMRALKGAGIGIFAVGILKLLFLPSLLVLIGSDIYLSWLVLLIPLTQWKIMNVFNQLNSTKVNFFDLLLFQLYEFIFYLSIFVFSWLPFRVNWKGRHFD